jgi:hypothetical protein
MQLRNTPLVAIVILAFITPLVCSGASSAYFIDSKLWEKSDTIIIGTVTSITSEESGDRMFNSVEVEVERYLKNPSEASTLVIHYTTYTLREWATPEGTVYEWISGIERMLGFKVGEKVYVFLRQVTPDFYEVLGGSQGKYSIFDGVAMNSDGRRINIPMPVSQTVMIEAGLGLAVFLTIWIKRDWLSERIVGVTNG